MLPKAMQIQIMETLDGEYVGGLRERHNHKHKQKQMCPEIGDVVIVHGDSRKTGKWTVGIVRKQFRGKRRSGKRSRALDAKKHSRSTSAVTLPSGAKGVSR